MNEPLPFTGERYVPGVKGEIWIEHWHRYHFARRWASGHVVLDVACGEGYGSALLAATAGQVIGVDVSPEAIAHARRQYAAVPNLRFECASCTRLPLADASVDVAVSFETIEHIAEQEAFLDELARVLKPGGWLVLSCPNRAEYRDKRGFENPFHVKELYREELAALLQPRFPSSAWFGQRQTFFSVIAPEHAGRAAGEVIEVEETDPAHATPRLENPLYFIVAASRSGAPAGETVVSVLSDRGDWVYRDYEKVMRDLNARAARNDELDRTVAELRGRAASPRGWREWLRFPLVRLGLLKE